MGHILSGASEILEVMQGAEVTRRKFFGYEEVLTGDPLPTFDGYVYFVQAENGLVKIGCTSDPDKRFRGLQNMSPMKLHLMRVLRVPWTGSNPRHYGVEKDFHQRFAHLREHGEWFRPEGDLAMVIGVTPWEPREQSEPEPYDGIAALAAAIGRQP